MDIAPGITKFVQSGSGAISRTYTDVLRETIRVTDFSGADAGLQIQAAIVAAPATGAIVDGLGLKGAQTASVNPFAGITKPITLLLGDVTISSSVQWAITSTDQDIIGVSRDRTKLVYTGGALTDFLLFDGTAIGNGIRFILKDISVYGNANVVNAITIKKAGRFIVDTVAAAECTGSGFNCLFCVLGNFVNPAVSSNLGTFTVIPDAGITFDWINPDNSSANKIENALMEGITGGIGIQEIHSQANVYLGGASEGNGTGIDMAATASNHTFYTMYMEANSSRDIVCRGFLNEFVACKALSAVASATEITSAAYLNKFIGGIYDQIVNSATNPITFSDLTVTTSFTDNGTGTVRRNVRDNSGPVSPDNVDSNPYRSLWIFSSSEALPTSLAVRAHASAQGTTNLTEWRDASDTLRTAISETGFIETTSLNGGPYTINGGMVTINTTGAAIQVGTAADTASYYRATLNAGATVVTFGVESTSGGQGWVGTETNKAFNIRTNNATVATFQDGSSGNPGKLTLVPITQANLGNGIQTNGTIAYCSDCTVANPCAGGGTGALAKRLNGVWRCD